MVWDKWMDGAVGTYACYFLSYGVVSTFDNRKFLVV